MLSQIDIFEALTAHYATIVEWSCHRYGKQVGQDYVHDAVILLLLTPKSSVIGLTDDQFLGLWRLYTTKAAIFAREHELRTIALMDTFPVQEKENYKYIRQLVGHLDLLGRRVIYRLYILGETLEECGAVLGVSRTLISRSRDEAIQRLGQIVLQDKEI